MGELRATSGADRPEYHQNREWSDALEAPRLDEHCREQLILAHEQIRGLRPVTMDLWVATLNPAYSDFLPLLKSTVRRVERAFTRMESYLIFMATVLSKDHQHADEAVRLLTGPFLLTGSIKAEMTRVNAKLSRLAMEDKDLAHTCDELQRGFRQFYYTSLSFT